MNPANANSKKIIGILFLAWLLTLPFGSKLFSLSLGFMTLYPNLLIGIALIFMTVRCIARWNLAMYVVGAFLLLWFVYAGVYIAVNGKTEMGVFHVRILGMQLLVAVLLFNMYLALGWSRFLELLKQGLRIYLHLLLVVGMFEAFSGMHIAGTQTEKFTDLEVSNLFYAPMFLYDNQNEFICYLLFLLALVMVIDKRIRFSDYAVLFYGTAVLFFSYVADARLGVIASFLILIVKCIQLLVKAKWLTDKWVPIAAVAVFLAISVVQLPVFLGPKILPYETFSNNKTVLIEDSTHTYYVPKMLKELDTTKEVISEKAKADKAGAPLTSNEVRKNMLLNGVAFIKEQPITGLGPGNFFNRIENGQAPYPTHTVRSPHNFVVEIIAQYGIIGWGYLLILLVLFSAFLRRYIRSRSAGLLYALLVFPLLGVMWLMPSSYLYLDIHWMLLPILICLYYTPEVFYEYGTMDQDN